MSEKMKADNAYDDYAEDTDGFQVEEYDITATPNDFNVMTLNKFMEGGSIHFPGFQRYFVWDIHRASKLIESLILGLPVPQLFLYEQKSNKFSVIDGQQRLMSITYFIKTRFPRKGKQARLRQILTEHRCIPDDVLGDDQYFRKFNLRLTAKLPGHKNKFNGLNYETLGEYKNQFNLRPIRNIVVKQNRPLDDDSCMYEIFNRLNTGGVNLRPQEIRASMYHSEFYTTLYKINNDAAWRKFLPDPDPDLHMKDVETLLRGFAMLTDNQNYAPSMVKFLNQFSRKSQENDDEKNKYLESLFKSFLEACSDLPKDTFLNKSNKRFNIALYEAVFTATGESAFAEDRLIEGKLNTKVIDDLVDDGQFKEATQAHTTQTKHVEKRLSRAREILGCTGRQL